MATDARSMLIVILLGVAHLIEFRLEGREGKREGGRGRIDERGEREGVRLVTLLC